MEKYLNSDFSSADEVSIKALQEYLSNLGYGKLLTIDGDFNKETRMALGLARSDLKLYSEIKKQGFQVLSRDEYMAFFNSEKKKIEKFMKDRPGIIKQEQLDEFKATAKKFYDEVKNKVIFLPLELTRSSYEEPHKTSNSMTALLEKNNVEKFYTEYPCYVYSWPDIIKYSLQDYNRDNNSNYTLKNLPEFSKENIFCTTSVILMRNIMYTDDKRLKRIEKFEYDVKVPELPEKKKVIINLPKIEEPVAVNKTPEKVSATKTPKPVIPDKRVEPEPYKPETEVKFSSDGTCVDKSVFDNFCVFVNNLANNSDKFTKSDVLKAEAERIAINEMIFKKTGIKDFISLSSGDRKSPENRSFYDPHESTCEGRGFPNKSRYVPIAYPTDNPNKSK